MDIINLMIYGTCEDWRTRNRRDVSQWIGAYRAKLELYTRYFGSVEDAETTLVDGRLDWTELRERLLSRNYGGVAQGWLSTETGKEVSLSQSAAIELYKCGECHVLGIQLYCF